MSQSKNMLRRKIGRRSTTPQKLLEEFLEEKEAEESEAQQREKEESKEHFCTELSLEDDLDGNYICDVYDEYGRRYDLGKDLLDDFWYDFKDDPEEYFDYEEKHNDPYNDFVDDLESCRPTPEEHYEKLWKECGYLEGEK